MRTYYIYTLSNPKNNEVFYVGITVNPEQRQYAHECEAKYYIHFDYKFKMIPNRVSYYSTHQILPLFEILDVVQTENKKEAEGVEEYWIQQCMSWGFPLTNWKGLKRQHGSQSMAILHHARIMKGYKTA